VPVRRELGRLDTRRSNMRFTMTLLSTLGAALVCCGLAAADDGVKPKKPHREAASPAKLHEQIAALRASVDRLRDETSRAAASRDAEAAERLAARARADAKRLERIEKRLAEATPPADRLRHREAGLEKRLEAARREGDAAAVARLESDLAAVKKREATVSERGERAKSSPDALEARSKAMLARAAELQQSGDTERAEAMRKSAASLHERADKLRTEGPREERPRPELPPAEVKALRGELASVRTELRRVRETLRPLAGEHPEHPARSHGAKPAGEPKQKSTR
jgi:DNA repair exonuclease SbcCD ATPase subunit